MNEIAPVTAIVVCSGGELVVSSWWNDEGAKHQMGPTVYTKNHSPVSSQRYDVEVQLKSHVVSK